MIELAPAMVRDDDAVDRVLDGELDVCRVQDCRRRSLENLEKDKIEGIRVSIEIAGVEMHTSFQPYLHFGILLEPWNYLRPFQRVIFQ